MKKTIALTLLTASVALADPRGYISPNPCDTDAPDAVSSNRCDLYGPVNANLDLMRGARNRYMHFACQVANLPDHQISRMRYEYDLLYDLRAKISYDLHLASSKFESDREWYQQYVVQSTSRSDFYWETATTGASFSEYCKQGF